MILFNYCWQRLILNNEEPNTVMFIFLINIIYFNYYQCVTNVNNYREHFLFIVKWDTPIRVWLSTTTWVNDTSSTTPCDTKKTVRASYRDKYRRLIKHSETFYCTDHSRISRYVVIQRITPDKKAALCLCEVQVFGGNYDSTC